jgi:hypothetical protein
MMGERAPEAIPPCAITGIGDLISRMSKLCHEANEIFTLARPKARQHGPANFDLARAYFRHESMPGRRKFDVHDSAVPRHAPTSHQMALFKPVKSRGDR